MSEVWHEAAMRNVVHAKLDEEPEWGRVLSRTADAISRGAYGDWPTIVGWSGLYYDVYDAYGFARVWEALQAGQCLPCQIDVGNGPGVDCAPTRNQQLLSRLPRPFAAEVFSGTHDDDDGTLLWEEPIIVGSRTSRGVIERNVHRGQAPLEIGDTTASRTLCHLRQGGRVARWPYGHKHITLLISCEALAQHERYGTKEN